MVTDTHTLFTKNAKALEEIAKRTFGLNPRIRQLLILIDGKRSEADLIKMLPGLDVVGTMQLLQDEGFISSSHREVGQATTAALANNNANNNANNATISVPVSAMADDETVQQRGRRLARLLTQTLGPNADDLALRIERCKSFEEIRELIPQVLGVVEGVAGPRAMADFTRKLGNV